MRTAAIGVASLLLFASLAAGVDIDTCGVTVTPGDTGRLIADLDCSTGGSGICIYPVLGVGDVACSTDSDCDVLPDFVRYCARDAVRLSSGAALDMNGHVITGAGITCAGPGRCTVTGPGEVVGAAAGIFGLTGRVDATGVTLRDGEYGVFARKVRLSLTDVHVTGNAHSGVIVIVGKIRLAGATSSDNGGYGFNARQVLGTDVTAIGNGDAGILARRVNIDGITVQGNAPVGVWADGMRLANGDVSGNGPGGSADLRSNRVPVLRNVTCGASGFTGLCAND